MDVSISNPHVWVIPVPPNPDTCRLISPVDDFSYSQLFVLR